MRRILILFIIKIKEDSQQKLEELSRRLGVLDDKFARSNERADHCDEKVKTE